MFGYVLNQFEKVLVIQFVSTQRFPFFEHEKFGKDLIEATLNNDTLVIDDASLFLVFFNFRRNVLFLRVKSERGGAFSTRRVV